MKRQFFVLAGCARPKIAGEKLLQERKGRGRLRDLARM
jgi:hypothetical protein